MEKKVMCSDNLDSEAMVERELWDALLHAKGVHCSWTGNEPLTAELFTVDETPHAKTAYPWDPASPESEPFFTELEQDFSLDDWDAQEISTRSNAFFNQVNQLWSAVTVQEILNQRFASRIPENLLMAISNRAQQVLMSTATLADQLVNCVDSILPNLAQDDLYVLARPLAYAMRNGESRRAIDTTLEKVRPVAWEELSDIEQARLSLAIARCALVELEMQNNE